MAHDAYLISSKAQWSETEYGPKDKGPAFGGGRMAVREQGSGVSGVLDHRGL